MQRRWPTVLRGFLAALALAALVLGVPILLVREVGWPLPTTLPSWNEVSQSITTGVIEDVTIIKALAVLVWMAWANFAAGALVEASAIARDGVARRVAGLGPAQHLAANLLATISVAVALLTRPAAPASATPGDLRVAVQDATIPRSSAPIGLTDRQLAPARAPTSEAGTARGVVADEAASVAAAASTSLYEVKSGDTLWDLADRLLGDGMRWRDIRDLNIGRHQPDGTTVSAATEDLRPGWTLRVPGRAPSEVAAAAPGVEAVVVEPGDTLWHLADEHLDDPYRWPEIYEENRGDPQPGGSTLTDPDLIQPGWVLDLPAPDTTEAAMSGVTGHAPPAAVGQDDPAAPAGEPAADITLPADAHDAVSEADGGNGAAGEPVAKPTEAVVQTTPRPSRDEPAERSEPADNEQAEDVALPIAAAGTVAAGLVLTLDRIRRARLRRRRPHHRIPLPTGDDAAAERRLRAHANPEADRLLNAALRELSAHYIDHRPGPSVVLVSHGSADVAVHLDAPSDASPDGWERHDHDHTWSRARPASLDTLDLQLGTPSRFPALVTLGTVPGGRVGLLNLAHAGCLHLDGVEDDARRLMAAWALELATTPRADALEVIAVGIDGLPDGLERLTTLADADELREVLGQPHSNGKADLPRIVILAAGLPAEVSLLLRTTSELRSDLVAVVSGIQPRSDNWSLHIEGSGRARLDPEGITFDLVDLVPSAVLLRAKLIEQALHDPEQLVQLYDDDQPETIRLDESAPEAGAVGAEPPADEPTTEVRVLGPVEIVGIVEPFRTNKTVELIVYLALHRRGADADTLLEALWPGQDPRPPRLYTEASRARKSLGTAAGGSPHLPDAELGRYRLADSVALDHERFTAAVAAARRDPDNAIDHLRRALMLVRGVPLSATAAEYAWATNDLYTLAQEIVDAAHDLAQLCLEAERYDDAIWAAERGLLADPLSELLVCDLMEAAAATGNTSRVHAAMTRLRRQVAEDADGNDADDWLSPATVRTFERLRRSDAAAAHHT